VTALDYTALIKIALDAVLTGAKIADEAIGIKVLNNKGSLRDIVTQKLNASGLPVISEEKHDPAEDTPDVFWVVDPIDGTVNFANGLPQFAVSAGLVENYEFKLGVVCAPSLDELYFTLNTERSLMNGRPFSHLHRPLADALLAASFSAKSPQNYYTLFQKLNESTRGCLRTGSAALNICWAAAGKLQAAYGFQAKLWDLAGALAIARAAGCEIALRYQPNAFTLDYCVGSKDAVEHVKNLAQKIGLWDEP
jgi:myo-inositol-1(or 4)-monophosphatase